MGSVLNTNVASLNAQRHLSSSQSALTTSMQRLSSGLRVNSAKDDAAGLAIAERMHAQVRGMNVAVRNANDGISMAQTAEGALGKVSDSLQRMRELAVQARNATNTAKDKDSLDKEFGELAKEIQRVLGGTTFNGKAILGADAGTMTFQVGAGVSADDVITVSLTNLATNSAITSVAGAQAPTTAQLAAASAAARDAVVADLTGKGHTDDATWVSANFQQVSSAGAAAEEYARVLGSNTTLYGSMFSGVEAGISAATSGAEANTLTRDAFLAKGAALGNANAGAMYLGNLAEIAYNAYAAIVPSSSTASIGASADPTAIATVITNIDSALDEINNQRATFGATLSRFDSVVANLNVSVENQSAARSRIMDADFASETANLSRAQILQQAGNAMVAQANQLPQSVLQLLG
ncbi:MAG: flagellin [Burkholderiaceae bacterium]|nr:flagellin [Burkholderiaceae bacterium]